MSRTSIRYTAGKARSRNKARMFSVTAADCRFDVFRGSGDGGQKKQKTSSGVRCVHEPSGAVGKATDSREQAQNRKNAFIRMTETAEFRAWMELEIDQRLGNVTAEVADGTGGWRPE
jgi:protein subunit release factor A